MRCIVDDDVVLSRPPAGPLSARIDAFAAWSREQGYTLRSRWRQVFLAACFCRWLGQRAVSERRVCAEHATEFLRSRARRVQIQPDDATVLRQFLEFLRREGSIPAEKVVAQRLTPVEQQTRDFEAYLRNERVLALRSFLRYARYRGELTTDLAAAVPCVPSWSMTSVPRGIPPDAVRRLLSSIDRRTSRGRRDYAILLLLARLGLRAREVTFLELDDFDWAAGQLSVRGKGGQRTLLPLSAEVGEAIAAYLRYGRPRTDSRRVFLRVKAPIRGFLDRRAIGSLVRSTLACAGIKAPTKGAHQFRHALATQMLRPGASLAEIGEVLRHRSPQTTMIYAKVDLDALRPLALPWPGGVRP